MPKHIAKCRVFMGGTLYYSGSPVEGSLIPEGFQKHFEGFDEKKADEPKKAAPKSQSEESIKLALELEGKKYGVDLDRRRPVARLEKDLAAAKAKFEKETV